MSKINIEFDTVSKMATVSKDGVTMDNVCYVSIYKTYSEEGEGPKFTISVESEERDASEKTSTRTVVYASEVAQSEFAAAVAARYAD
jgi:hypothetical protein